MIAHPIPMTNVTRDSLQSFMEDGFVTLGLPPDDAKIFADALIFSELRFHPGHGQGVKRLRRYHERISKGLVDPKTRLEVIKESPALALVDAHNGIGTVAAARAMKMAIAKAKVCGIGQVIVRNSTHYGSSAVHAVQAAEPAASAPPTPTPAPKWPHGAGARGPWAPTRGASPRPPTSVSRW
jgi:LDH2 family malate/lactate/ureidoglycolate dehydrogenase